jgi:hypothetical protein
MSDELHVREFTITDADGNVRKGKYGVITGEGIDRLLDAASLLQTAHNCRAEPHCLCGENAWYHRDTDDEGMSGAAECGLTGCTCTTYRRCLEYKRVENCS